MSEETTPGSKPGKGLKRFTLIWVGQLVSLLGSGLTRFALGIWVLQRTDSVTQFVLITVIAGLPGILLAPIAGALVDRWDRRRVMIAADVGAALITLAVALLLWQDSLQVWHIYLLAGLGSVLSTFQWPAYIASITLLVKPEQYGRVNGLLQFGEAGTTIAAPALAGLAMVTIDIWGILLVDFATFLVAVTTLLLVRIPRPKRSEAGREGEGSIWKEAAYGWTYIKARPGLLGLLFYFAGINFVTSMCGIAILPMVLRVGSEVSAGTVLSCIGIGMLLGSTYMSVTGGPKRRINGVLGFGVMFSVFIFLAGVSPAVWWIAGAVLLWHANIPVINSCSQAIWQSKVEPDVQGRVFAMRRMIAQFTVPLGDFSAGPLTDHVFEPLMAEGGSLAPTLGPLIGSGPGRGIALMFIVFAIFPMLTSLWGYMNPHVRNIEDELPDVDTEGEEEEEPAEDAVDGEEASGEDRPVSDAEEPDAAEPDAVETDAAEPLAEEATDPN
ncbi:MAG: MFS transporter [bacterium]|nr:MFS transporter [bacterium]